MRVLFQKQNIAMLTFRASCDRVGCFVFTGTVTGNATLQKKIAEDSHIHNLLNSVQIQIQQLGCAEQDNRRLNLCSP